MDEPILTVDGLVDRPLRLTRAELAQLDVAHQVADVRRLGAKRAGQAVRLAAILELARATGSATHLGLHGAHDDFHASLPLQPLLERGLVIYAVDGQALPVPDGGPFRFFIPDHAACHTDEIDECANVKHLSRIELTSTKGFDNRPQDDEAHARLHQQ
jgi:DMSO/TMAO reductase YedYZ molybdopterin-dependent catalytic subunit